METAPQEVQETCGAKDVKRAPTGRGGWKPQNFYVGVPTLEVARRSDWEEGQTNLWRTQIENWVWGGFWILAHITSKYGN